MWTELYLCSGVIIFLPFYLPFLFIPLAYLVCHTFSPERMTNILTKNWSCTFPNGYVCRVVIGPFKESGHQICSGRHAPLCMDILMVVDFPLAWYHYLPHWLVLWRSFSLRPFTGLSLSITFVFHTAPWFCGLFAYSVSLHPSSWSNTSSWVTRVCRVTVSSSAQFRFRMYPSPPAPTPTPNSQIIYSPWLS